MWDLRELVERYVTMAGAFGTPIPLANFSLPDTEIVRLFNSFDEDYHISRYLQFSKVSGKAYRIGIEQVTHLSIDASIEEVL